MINFSWRDVAFEAGFLVFLTLSFMAVEHTVRFAWREGKVRLKHRKTRKPQYKPPIGCRTFGHLWSQSKYTAATNPFFDSDIEICTRCGGGRVLGLGGFDKYTPAAVQRYIEKIEAEKSGKVLSLKGGTDEQNGQKADTPNPAS